MILSDSVCQVIARAFKVGSGQPMAERVLAARDAAQHAGGDIHGKQSAALIVVPGTATEPWTNKTIDVRVDNKELPLKELHRLYNLHIAYIHMNNADLPTEKNDMTLAKAEYNINFH